MKKILLPSIMFCVLTGCQAKPAAPAPDSDSAPAAQAKPQLSQEEQAADKARFERDIAQAEKLAKSGQFLPPKIDIKLDIVDHNDKISSDEVNLSYEFVKAAINACYTRALAYDLSTKGTVILDVTGNSDRTSQCNVKESDTHSEEFDSCVLKACHRWPAPKDAKFQAKFVFSSERPKAVS